MHHAAHAARPLLLAAAIAQAVVTALPGAPAAETMAAAPAEAAHPGIFSQVWSRLEAIAAGQPAAAAAPLDPAAVVVHIRLLNLAIEAVAHWAPSVAEQAAATVADLSILGTAPVPDVKSSGYGWRSDPINRRHKFHAGTDYRADKGTPVYAAAGGVVIRAGRHRGYGNVIDIDHGNGITTRYAHLSKMGVKEGDAVTAALKIGAVGSTGRSTGPHLHFEVRIQNRPVDPVLAMQIGELQRTAPDLANLLARSLAPSAEDGDEAEAVAKADADKKRRPERRGRTARDPNLW